ncbi:MAG: Swt1 family HEPN domain-containing protein [Janthinobacterium lividum]
MKANYTYHNEAVKAFQSLDEGLRPFVKQEMLAVYKEHWLDNIANSVKWEREEPIWDTLALLHTIRVNWTNVFKMDRLRGPEEIGKVSALIDWRHRIQGHSPKPVDKDEAYSAINSMLHLLKSIGATTEVGEVEQLLVSFRPLASLEANKDLQLAQIKNEAPSISLINVSEEVEAELQRLESIVSSTTPPSPIVANAISTVTPSMTPPLPNADILRIECIKDTKTKWWLLQIYDGNKFMGSYERSGTEEDAKEKEIEIPCSATDLRAAFLANGNQPFVVRYNGASRTKQIKSDDSKTAVILGTIPKNCWRTVLKK